MPVTVRVVVATAVFMAAAVEALAPLEVTETLALLTVVMELMVSNAVSLAALCIMEEVVEEGAEVVVL